MTREKKRKDYAFGVNLMGSQVLYRAAQGTEQVRLNVSALC